MLILEISCQLVGAITILGSLILIFKQKVYLDAVTKQVMYVELPKIGKLRTNAPVLAVIVLGALLVVFPVYLAHTAYITVEQDVDSDLPLTVNAYAVSKQSTVGNDKHLTLAFPNLPDSDYQPHLVLHVGSVFWDQAIHTELAHHGKIVLEKTLLRDVNPLCRQEPRLAPISDSKPPGYK